MNNSSQDLNNTPNPKSDPDPYRTRGEDDSPSIGSDNKSTDQNSNAELLETIIPTLVPEQQDLDHTLPYITLRPQALPTTSDPTYSASVRPRSIRPAGDGPSQSSDDSSTAGDAPDYITMQLLGQGGMGTVHLARQITLGRAVAVKQIQTNHRQQQSVQDEFLTEAILTGRLEHPNIVPIYEVGRSPDDTLFYSMKNIKGRAWSDTIENLSLEENLDILIDVCDAIAFAHAEGVIHRDLKPQNIMTGGFGEVLVLDWGLALTIGPDTRVESLAGTPAFLAPEMINPPFGVGPHSDIYLLGANLFLLLTGKPPHGGTSARDCLMAASQNQIVTPEEDRLRELDPSGELLGIAMRAMATKVENRYPTVTEFQQAIRDFRSHHESLEMSTRAEGSLASAKATGDYDQYSRAVFGFEEASKIWDKNVEAKEGFVAARLNWALYAEEQGDFDLVLSLLDDSVAEQQEIGARVTAARDQREAHRHHARRLWRFSIATGVVILLGAIGFGFYQKSVTERLANQAGTISQQLASIKTEQTRTKSALAAERDAKSLAVEQRETAERQLYINHIQSAQREWETDNAAAAWPHLDACRENLRGWEYRYLHSLFTRNQEPLRGHAGRVISVAFSADGSRIVSGSADKTLKLWNANTGKETMTLKGHASSVYAVAFSPDDSHIVSGSREGMLKLWDASTGDETLMLKGHPDFVTSVAFSPDGSRIVSGSVDKTLKLWDASTGKETMTLKGHTGWVSSVAFSPDGSRIVSGSADKTLKLWDASTGEETMTLNGHTDRVMSVAFSPDGGRIVSGGAGRPGTLECTLKLWDANTGEETMTLEGHISYVSSVAFSLDGSRIVSGSLDKTVRIWDASTGEETMTHKGHPDQVRSVAFSLDGSRIVSGSDDKTLMLWDASTGEETMTFKGHTDFVVSGAFSPNASRIVSGSFDNTLKLWDARTGEEITTFKGHTGRVSSVAFSPDGSRIVSGSDDKTLKLWDASTGEETLTLKGHTAGVHSVAFSPDGSRIVSGSDDNTLLKLWDASTGEETMTLKGHTGGVHSVAFSPDGSRIVSGSDDTTLKLWDASTGEETLTLKGHTSIVASVAFSPDGSRIVSGDWDSILKLWDASTGEETMTFKGHTGYVTSVAFSPDGSRTISGSGDNTLKLWDASTGEETMTLKGNAGEVTFVAFSPDGSRIISGGTDNTFRLWDASSADGLFSRRQRAAGSAELGAAANHRRRAALAEKTNDWYAAAFHLGWLMALNPDDMSLQERRAIAETKLGEQRLAMPQLPSELVDLGSLDLTYAGILQSLPTPDAKRVLREALARQQEKDPDSRLTRHMRSLLGASLYINGEFVTAVEQLTMAVESRHDHSVTELLLLALAHHELKQSEQAREIYDQAIELLKRHTANAKQRELAQQAMTKIEGLSGEDAKSRIASLTAPRVVTLPWISAADSKCPTPQKSLKPIQVTFKNETDNAVSLLWVDFYGKRQPFKKLQPQETYQQQTFATHAWLVTDEAGEELGHFIATDQPAWAVIKDPPKQP